MMPRPPDADVRASAIDPRRSFIVQAPAGAGKTELLIQRLLALLAEAREPGEILAITFTRKAAGEMRARLHQALLAARDTACPEDEPARSRWQGARRVLERDQAHGWGLLERREALLIETFDALARRLAQAGWTLEPGIHANLADLDEDAHELYAEAASAALRAEDDPELVAATRMLLGRLDNRAQALVQGVAELLGRRGQWAGFSLTDAQAALTMLDRTLIEAIEAELQVLHRLWGMTEHETARHMAHHASRHHPDPARAEDLAVLAESPRPGPRIADLSLWRSLAELLLTSSGTWRRALDKRCGFPPGEGKGKTKAQDPRQLAKEAMTAFVQALEVREDTGQLASLLHATRGMPDRAALAEQADVRAAMLRLLQRALAELQWRQSNRASTDFAGVFAAARYVLAENATGLAERLDARIRHILVDEFQDTNPEQAELLEMLVSGWSPGDGRTLFLVGDPMQSIYAFRDADVSIFLTVMAHGLGTVSLETLRLTSNFRSRPALIDWVNQTMPHALASRDGLQAIPFVPAQAVRWDAAGTGLAPLAVYADAEEEAEAIAQQIMQVRAEHAEASMAVLVRTRRQAEPILAALSQCEIPVRAIDMTHLSERPVVRDLMALTFSLAYPADRLAWMSWLRSPYVGLRLTSLLSLAESSCLDLTTQLERVADPEDRRRLERLAEALDRDRMLAGRLGLAERVWRILLDCGGAAALADPDTRREVQSFLAKLEALSAEGLLADRARLEGQLARQTESFSTRHGQVAAVEVLTMHKAKGLEWDHVFLPGLDLGARARRRSPLIWQFQRRIGQEDARRTMLLAASSSRKQNPGSVYDFIHARLGSAEREETIRLLYVALTRARERLYLSGQRSGHRIVSGALAALLPGWPESQAPGETEAEQVVPNEAGWRIAASLQRLPLPEGSGQPESHGSRPAISTEDLAKDSGRALGIVGHRLLELLHRHGRSGGRIEELSFDQAAVSSQIIQQGVPRDQAHVQAKQLVEHLQRLLAQSEALRFVLGPHAQETAELDWALAGRVLRPDRCFRTASGECWVVDYKFVRGDLVAAENFRTQLEGYAELAKALGWIEPGQRPKLAIYAVWQDRLDYLP